MKTDVPRVVDPDAVLSIAITGEFLQPVARRHAQVIQFFGGIQDGQFLPGDFVQAGRKPLGKFSGKDAFRIFVVEGFDYFDL